MPEGISRSSTTARASRATWPATGVAQRVTSSLSVPNRELATTVPVMALAPPVITVRKARVT